MSDNPARRLVRTILLRTTFLLIGAALFLAFAVLALSIAAAGRDSVNAVVVVAGLALLTALVAAVSLFPGVRDIEVSAARILLRPGGELLDYPVTLGQHRWRTTAFVVAHVLLGGAAGTGLVIGLPSAVLELPWYAAVAAVTLIVAAVAALGFVLAHLAVAWLGPTDADRLAVAEQRLAHEHAQRILARDLHDGIGHALSVISLQAQAGQRVARLDTTHVEESLKIIAATARTALDELDHALGVLRDEPADRAVQQRLDDLPALAASYQSSGTDVRTDLADASSIPDLVSREAFRIVQEALTNASKHGDDTPITVTTQIGDMLEVEVRNGIADFSSRSASVGRGLAGLRERVALLGGDLDVGAVDHATWVLRARIVLPTAEERAR